MKKQIATNPAYRRVVAALDDCEKRYDGLIKRTGATNDLRLASTVAILKGEVEQRRRLEVELLTAVESERQRIGQDLHDDLCQRLGAIALLSGSLAKEVSVLDKKLGEKVGETPSLITETIGSCRNPRRCFLTGVEDQRHAGERRYLRRNKAGRYKKEVSVGRTDPQLRLSGIDPNRGRFSLARQLPSAAR
jgi:hypothetical protein